MKINATSFQSVDKKPSDLSMQTIDVWYSCNCRKGLTRFSDADSKDILTNTFWHIQQCPQISCHYHTENQSLIRQINKRKKEFRLFIVQRRIKLGPT